MFARDDAWELPVEGTKRLLTTQIGHTHLTLPCVELTFPCVELAERRLINQTVRKLTRNDQSRFELMQNQKRIKGLKLVAILLAAGVFSEHMQAIVGAQGKPPRLFEIAGMSVPLEQRIGVDDGAAFVVHFAGDTHGTLDACG